MSRFSAGFRSAVSASALERISLCPPSAFLPAVVDLLEDKGDAKRGTIIHRFLADVPKVGRDEALLAVEDLEVRAICSAIDLAQLPIDGVEYAAEVAFAYDPATDRGRELGRDLERAYDDLRPGEVPGTADVVGLTADGEGVIIYDYKSGWKTVTPARRNLQLGFLALAACRAYGRRRAHVAIISLKDPERPEFDRWEWNELELDVWANEILSLLEVVDGQRAAWRGDADGASLALAVGNHCEYCPARRRCSAWSTMIVALARDPRAELLDLSSPTTLTEEQIASAWHRLKAMQSILETAETVIKSYATVNGGVDIGDGLTLAPVLTERETVIGRIAREVLEEKHGKTIADRAAEWKVSKKSIEDALRKVAQERTNAGGKKVPLAPLVREVLEELATRGGLTVTTTPSVKEIRR